MASGTQKEIKISSVYFWESGGTSCFNDDRVIGPRNLVTERASRGYVSGRVGIKKSYSFPTDVNFKTPQKDIS